MEEDVLLVHQTLLGDENAYHRLIKKYQKAIYAQILSIVHSPADAEELTADVFIKAYQNLSSLRQPDKVFWWLVKIAKNHSQNWLQRHQTHFLSLEEIFRTKELPSFTREVEDRLLRREKYHKTLEAIEELPEIDKALMKGFYLEGASYKTLQKWHGLSKGAVAMRLFKAKRKVKERVEKMLSGIVAFPWRDALTKLFLGGMQLVKISVTTKLVMVWTTTLLMLVGIIVFVWQTKPSKPVMSKPVVHQTTNEASQKELMFRNSISKHNTSVAPIQEPEASQADEDSVEDRISAEQLLDWLEEIALETSNELSESEEELFPTEEDKSDDKEKEAEIEALKTDITMLIFEIGRVVERRERLYREQIPGHPDPEIDRCTIARRELGDQAMRKIIRYITLTSDRAATYPGGWIYELGQENNFFIAHGQ